MCAVVCDHRKFLKIDGRFASAETRQSERWGSVCDKTDVERMGSARVRIVSDLCFPKGSMGPDNYATREMSPNNRFGW